MHRILRNPLFIFFILYLISAGSLQYVTGIVEATGNKVPDLLLMPNVDEATVVLSSLRASNALSVYLLALWTLDVIFPFAYQGLLRTLMPPTVGWLRHLPMGAACVDGVENLSITAFLVTGEPIFVLAYVACNGGKFTLLALSAVIALSSRLWYHRTWYVPLLRRLAVR